ncbi:MAG: uncharacterized protein K0S16_643 [Moraxellaceae bacterium]|jgi:hypothetical protein|nr:uncharacterized protein [Moraxellaceae bacterium]
MTSLLRRSLPFLFALSLTACGGGDDSAPAPAGDVGNYAPYAVGNRWLYETSRESLPAAPVGALTEVSATTLPDDRAALELRTQSLETLLTNAQLYLQKRPDALYQLFSPFGGRIISGVDALPLLRFPLRAGDSYTAFRYDNIELGVDWDDDGINERHSHRLDIAVVGTESVTVPAGTFPEALKVVATRTFSETYSQGASFSTVITTTSWYVPEVGVVKVRTETVSDGGPVTVDHQALVSYRIDGVRSESVAPTVQGVTPAPDSTVSAGLGVSARVTFSEELDPVSVNATTLTMQDADGNAIPGSVVYSSRKLTFIPAYLLPDGTYTATLATGPTDVLGTPLATPYTWTFTKTADTSDCLGSSRFC